MVNEMIETFIEMFIRAVIATLRAILLLGLIFAPVLLGLIIVWLPQHIWANRKIRELKEREKERELRRQRANVVPVISPNDLEDLERK